MKLLILANPDNPHTIKWVRSLSKEGVQIYLFGLNEFDTSIYEGYNNVQVQSVGLKNGFIRSKIGNFSKLSYAKFLPGVKKIIKTFQPDIIHAHYASSYGILAALTGFSPILISVWGSDVYKFPRISIFHKLLIKYCFSKAEYILSTSKIMREEVKKYTRKKVEVTPFGVDVGVFNSNGNGRNGEVVIGTVKNLCKLYGIDVLIKAFKLVVEEKDNKSLRLLIVGEGREKQRLIKLVKHLDLEDKVEFVGKTSPDLVPYYLNRMNIFAALSVGDESFGVSVLEAASCEIPVVVSNAPGFQEIVEHEHSGLIVPRNNVDKAAEALSRLVDDHELGNFMGKNGRKIVQEKYDLSDNVEMMKQVYQKTLTKG